MMPPRRCCLFDFVLFCRKAPLILKVAHGYTIAGAADSAGLAFSLRQKRLKGGKRIYQFSTLWPPARRDSRAFHRRLISGLRGGISPPAVALHDGLPRRSGCHSLPERKGMYREYHTMPPPSSPKHMTRHFRRPEEECFHDMTAVLLPKFSRYAVDALDAQLSISMASSSAIYRRNGHRRAPAVIEK